MTWCTNGVSLAWALMIQPVPANTIDFQRTVLACYSDQAGCLRGQLAAQAVLTMHGLDKTRWLTCELENPK